MSSPLDVLKFCNCAGCNRLLLGLSCKDFVRRMTPEEKNKLQLPAFVAGRIKGRPYCVLCLSEPTPDLPSKGTGKEEAKRRRGKQYLED